MPIVDLTTANRASIVNTISPNLSNTLAPVDSTPAGATAQRADVSALETLAEPDVQVSTLSSIGDVENASDVDMEKVAALRQAIDSGTYQVSSQDIFDGLAASVKETQGTDIQ